MGRYKVYSDMKINKSMFIRLLAEESGFTLTDTRDFWNAFEKLFAKFIINRANVNISGFGKFYVKKVKAFRAWDGLNKKRFDRPETERICFTPSKTLSRLKTVLHDFEYIEENDDDK